MRLLKRLFSKWFGCINGYVKGWKDGYGVGRADAEKPFILDPLALMEFMNSKR